jgi:transposase
VDTSTQPEWLPEREMVHKPKRRFSGEFKAHAVELVRVSGKTATGVAKDLGISTAALCRWVGKAEAAAARPGSQSEAEELKRLRKEVETLRMERDFLKKAAAFFAKESK